MIWNLTKTEKDKAQITIYGPIKDFSSFFSDSGTSPQKIMKDLDELANVKEITVRINSGGGSAFAGLAIFELLRAHGAKIITRNDGLAASAASIILMAGDVIIMGTGSMTMAHNPWTRVEGESKDLRAAADLLDRVGESLINVYSSRTKKSREDLRDMMNKTTWMTAEEAVNMGFADEIDQKFVVAASIQGENAVFNEQKFELSCFAEAPELPVKSEELIEPNVAINEDPVTKEEPVKQEIEKEEDTVKDLEELKAKHPAIFEAAIQSGVDQERGRIKALDELIMPGNAELINKAKYETFATAEKTAVDILKADNQRRINAGANLQVDSNASGIDTVVSTEAEAFTDKTKADDAQADKISAAANKKRTGRTVTNE